MLTKNPASVYRKVDLDARIEASAGTDLTRICLEEVVAALGQAEVAMKRTPKLAPRDSITRAHGIALWLARSVAPDNPLREQLVQFYGGLAAMIGRNLLQARIEDIRQARTDFADLLAAATAHAPASAS